MHLDDKINDFKLVSKFIDMIVIFNSMVDFKKYLSEMKLFKTNTSLVSNIRSKNLKGCTRLGFKMTFFVIK